MTAGLHSPFQRYKGLVNSDKLHHFKHSTALVVPNKNLLPPSRPPQESEWEVHTGADSTPIRRRLQVHCKNSLILFRIGAWVRSCNEGRADILPRPHPLAPISWPWYSASRVAVASRAFR